MEIYYILNTYTRNKQLTRIIIYFMIDFYICYLINDIQIMKRKTTDKDVVKGKW